MTDFQWKRTGALATVLLGCTLMAPAGDAADEAKAESAFTGWEGMRVLRQEGFPSIVRTADLEGDERDELLVVNLRQSRIEIYSWLDADEREPIELDPERPNELPMAPELKRTEMTLERLPRDVLLRNLDADAELEMVVLETPPLRVAIYDRNADGKWESQRSWNLLPGQLSGRDRAMLWYPVLEEGEPTVMVSFSEGIQVLKLGESSRPTWIEPREKKARIDWWSVDLDGDDDQDIVEWTRDDKYNVRWRQNVGSALLPAEGVSDVRADWVEVMPGADQDRPAELLLLGGTQEGLLRRYVLDDGEATVLGRRHVLPLEGADNASWSGMMLGEKKVLVLVDPAQPRVLSFRLTDAGWINDDSYPIISDVQAIASVAAEPGTLLLWAKDAADLHVSRWEDGRLTYPRPMTAEAPEGDRVLALDRVGQTTWWVRKRGEDLHLYRWSPGMDGPSETRFAGAGGKADKAKWIGGERLLVMEKYARNPVLVQLREGKAITTTPGQLSKASLDDYVLLEVGEQGGSFRAARIADGVLQWVDDDLNPSDQVMLPDGLNLSAYVPIDEKQAWALQSGGERIHRMAADASGIMRVVDSIETAGGGRLLRDPVLGLLLIDGTQLTQLTEGTHRELRLIDTIDSRVGRPSGVREATIHRLWTIDITGDGDTELVQSDDNRHQLTALRRDDEQMTALMSWPVFEDSSYPYGGVGNDRRQNEPRAIAALDIDGDDRQDLALLVHDRLLFYLGREKADDSQLLTREGK